MPSEAMFYPAMKVRDVIRFAAKMRKMDCSKEADMLCERLLIDPNKRIEELSLGNRKKVSIVCAMQHKPKLFIFDEPTRGIDIGAKSEMYELMEDLAKEGKSIIMISSELSEVQRLSDRVVVMCEGRVTAELDIKDATQEEIMKYATMRD